jgi:hypothetical protein
LSTQPPPPPVTLDLLFPLSCDIFNCGELTACMG